MATTTQTQTLTNGNSNGVDETKKLISDLEGTHTLPLWAQMAKYNPPAPNPTAVPHLWRYDEIKPHLTRAGELITEKQAERRVLMLINPNRGKFLSSITCNYFAFTKTCHRNTILIFSSRTIHNRHPLRWSPTRHAQRDRSRPPAHGIRHALHHRRTRRLHRRTRQTHYDETRRRHSNADLELA